MKVLLTGASGFLGGRSALFLASRSYDIAIGTRKAVTQILWAPAIAVVQTQWDSLGALEEICERVDSIVHLAGMNAQDCAANPVGALNFNGVCTARLLQAAVKQRVKRFIYVSTAHVYGSPLIGVVKEEDCPCALHPYATSHRAGEDAVRAAHERGDISGIVVRLSNAYGAPAHSDANCWTLLANDVCKQAVATGRIVINSSGLQRRDFITVTDACRAINHLLELPGGSIGNGVFNVGGDWAPTVLEMTERIADRVCHITGQMPGIARNVERGPEKSEPLEYSMTKLKATGFSASGPEAADLEIDRLIEFCLLHRTDPR